MSNPFPAFADGLDSLLAGDVVEYCLRITGLGRVRLLGQRLEPLVKPLRLAGNVVEVGLLEDPSPVGPDLLIAWVESVSELPGVLAHSAGTLVVIGHPCREMFVWEEFASVHGWQLHPGVYALPAPPEDLAVMALSRRGVDAGDGRVRQLASFYGLAAALVRPGDAVVALDAVQAGVWRIIQQQSRCRWLGVPCDSVPAASNDPGVEWLASQQGLSGLRSVDVIIAQIGEEAHEVQQQVIDLAGEALIRSGRLVVAISLGVFDQERTAQFVHALERSGFVVDRAWWQYSQRPVGISQCVEADRSASGVVDLVSVSDAAAEQLVLLAVRVEGQGIVQDPALRCPNLIAFQRDYVDASTVRLIVAIGLRLETAALRRRVARQVMDQYPESSADYGAALCVLLYDPDALRGIDRAPLVEAALRYIESQASNPTVLRWQVSLVFCLACLFQEDGAWETAASLYARVLSFDVLGFSPLLGTKTTMAAMRLGWLQFVAGDIAAARTSWARGLDEARRLAAQSAWTEVVGNPDAPETFALPEFAAVMDEAGRLASALRVTFEHPERVGQAWQLGNQSWRLQLERFHRDRQRWVRDYAEYQRGKEWLEEQYRGLTEELARSGDVREWLDGECRRLTEQLVHTEEARVWLDGQYHSLTSELANRARSIDDLTSQARNQAAEIAALSAEIAALSAEMAVLSDAYAALEAETARLINRCRSIFGASTRLADLGSVLEQVSALADLIGRLPLKRGISVVMRMLFNLTRRG